MRTPIPSLVVSLPSFLLIFGIFSNAPAAEIHVDLGSGYSPFSVLKTDQSVAISVIPVVGSLSLKFKSIPSWCFGISAHASQLYFKQNVVSYSGMYNASGVNVEYNIQLTDKYQLKLHQEVLLFSQLTTKAQTTSTVNDEEFQHSALITLKSKNLSPGFLSRIAWTEHPKGLVSPKIVNYGIALDVLTQTFDEKNIDLASNVSSILPNQTQKHNSTSTWFYTSLNLIINFTI